MKKWLPVVLLAACSTAQWDKPGATPEAVDARASTTWFVWFCGSPPSNDADHTTSIWQ